MEPEDALPCSQDKVTEALHEPEESNPHPTPYFVLLLSIIIISASHELLFRECN
jgi:hypothetical protein